VQNYTTYVAAVTSEAQFRAAGEDFVRFLCSSTARQAFATVGMQ
jgi:ABC-type molybdate transport system substrate-binding protein